MAKVVALGGAGHIGSCGVRELVRKAPDIEVVVADYNLVAAERLCAELGGRTSAVLADVTDFAGLVRTMQGAELVINTVGPFYLYGETILKGAIEAKTNLVDVCDEGEPTVKMLSLHEEARKAGVTAVIGLGATPGITNLMAKRGADKLDRVDDIDTAWAWTAIDPKMTGPAIIEHYFHAITGEIETFRDGKWVKIPAISNRKNMEFVAPIGLFEVAEVGHPEPVTLPRYIPSVKNVANFGGVWPKTFEELAMSWKQLGLAETKEITIAGHTVPARTVATYVVLALPEIAPDLIVSMVSDVMNSYGEFGIEGVVLKVEVRGEKEGRPARFSFGCGAAADRLTALPSVLGAIMAIRGQLNGGPGVFAPEGIVDQEIFFKELTKDIPVQETAVKLIA